MSAPLLRATGLSKSFGGVAALRDVSLALPEGEIAAVIGPNGAGKSTLFNALSGQVWPDAGRVEIGGRSTAGLTPREICRLGVGRTFQVAATFGSMSVRENVQVALLDGAGTAWRPWGRMGGGDEAGRLCALVGLGELVDRPCAELAYGDLKRLDLAIALSNRPRLLLMDEPTAGMAPGEREAMMSTVVRLARDSRIGILFTEHDMDVVFGHADRVLVLDRGRLVAEGRPGDIRDDPAVKAIYLGEGLTFARGAADA